MEEEANGRERNPGRWPTHDTRLPDPLCGGRKRWGVACGVLEVAQSPSRHHLTPIHPRLNHRRQRPQCLQRPAQFPAPSTFHLLPPNHPVVPSTPPHSSISATTPTQSPSTTLRPSFRPATSTMTPHTPYTSEPLVGPPHSMLRNCTGACSVL